MELLSPATERITFFVPYGFIWLVLVLVQDNSDIKSDNTLRVTILQQKTFPETLNSELQQ